jgi:hypothetical protein
MVTRLPLLQCAPQAKKTSPQDSPRPHETMAAVACEIRQLVGIVRRVAAGSVQRAVDVMIIRRDARWIGSRSSWIGAQRCIQDDYSQTHSQIAIDEKPAYR